MDFPAHPFWDFALKVYGSPGVGEACLDVQERLGMDVNVLLFCCWVGESGRGSLTSEALAHACEAVAEWHEAVVRKLRSVRRALKTGVGSVPKEFADGLRRQIQAREIDAEHVEQLMLVASIGAIAAAESRPAAARAEDAVENVARYVARLDKSPTGADARALATILAATFPALGRERIETVLARRIGIAF
jgi:uncharacterized protein (TIGR02444 family)